jgi:hypothetical protein
MYGIFLIIAKVVSDALAAAFGILGLLFDFKDEHKRVTRSGRVALIGIITTFLVSGVITVLEAMKSHDDDKRHQKAEETTRQTYEQTEAKLKSELEAAYQQGSRSEMRPIGDAIQMDVTFRADRIVSTHPANSDSPEPTGQEPILQPNSDGPTEEEVNPVPAIVSLQFFKTPVLCDDEVRYRKGDLTFRCIPHSRKLVLATSSPTVPGIPKPPYL